MTSQILTQERLKELFSYDPGSGDFTRIMVTNRWKKGSKAGGLGGRGYISIEISGKTYKAHRLAWLYMTGNWPDEIDHINHNKADNRIINLRSATRSENCKNRTINKNNKCGVMGVDWRESANKWRSRINVNGKDVFLGYFDKMSDAVIARKEAEKKYRFHVNHGLDACHS